MTPAERERLIKFYMELYRHHLALAHAAKVMADALRDITPPEAQPLRGETVTFTPVMERKG